MKNIVAYSVYDTNTMQFISMCCVVTFQTANINYMFEPFTGSMRDMHFLRININNYYNNNINSVDNRNHICNQ